VITGDNAQGLSLIVDGGALVSAIRHCLKIRVKPRPLLYNRHGSSENARSQSWAKSFNYFTDRSHAEKALRIFSRGWPSLRAT
jgi:hypothetical protein